MFRIIEIGLFAAVGVASLVYLGILGYKIAKGSKSRLDRDIDETLLKTRKKDK